MASKKVASRRRSKTKATASDKCKLVPARVGKNNKGKPNPAFEAIEAAGKPIVTAEGIKNPHKFDASDVDDPIAFPPDKFVPMSADNEINDLSGFLRWLEDEMIVPPFDLPATVLLATDILEALGILDYPDLPESLKTLSAQTYLRRLRKWGRLKLQQVEPPTAGSNDNKEVESHSVRLEISLERSTAILDGCEFDVSSENALRWLAVLTAHPDEWISGSELAKHDPLLLNKRSDKFKQFLPEPILALIDSETGKGSRLRLGSGRSKP